MLNQVTVFGVGLIGGSLALALKRSKFCRRIVGCSRSASHLQTALELGVIDHFETDAAAAAAGADLIFLSVPLGAMEAVMCSFRDVVTPATIITDGGSSKASVVAAAKAVFGSVPNRFVPAHPIAGREKSGVEAALDSLYQDHKVIVTPLEHTDADAIATVEKMWQSTGAHVERLGVLQHDQVLAATSHLPHAVAYALVDTLSKTNYVDQIFNFAAGGFRDLSRIASSDPTMWRDICLENKTALLEMITAYQISLQQIKSSVESGDAEGLFEIFQHAKTTRDRYIR